MQAHRFRHRPCWLFTRIPAFFYRLYYAGELLSLLGFSVNLTECSTGSDRGWLCRAQCLQTTSSRVRLRDNIPDTFLGTLAFWIFLSFPRLWWVARAPASRYSLHWNTLWITGGKKTLLREWTSEKNTSPCLSHIQNIVKENSLHRKKTLEIWQMLRMTSVKQHRCHSHIQNVWRQMQGLPMMSIHSY